MAHTVGAMLLPVPVPGKNESLGDPALDLLGDFFKTTLSYYLGDAWKSVFPNEPVVRTLEKFDPEECEFLDKALPTLYVWRVEDESPSKLTDLHSESLSLLHLLWVAPRAPKARLGERHSFFTAFKNYVHMMVQNERDPSWIREGDESAEADVYGTGILNAAKVDRWFVRRVSRVPVVIAVGGTDLVYEGYQASIQLAELTVTDSTAFKTSPTVIHGDLTTLETELGAGDAVIRGSFREPVS